MVWRVTPGVPPEPFEPRPGVHTTPKITLIKVWSTATFLCPNTTLGPFTIVVQKMASGEKRKEAGAEESDADAPAKKSKKDSPVARFKEAMLTSKFAAFSDKFKWYDEPKEYEDLIAGGIDVVSKLIGADAAGPLLTFMRPFFATEVAEATTGKRFCLTAGAFCKDVVAFEIFTTLSCKIPLRSGHLAEKGTGKSEANI